MNSRDDDDRAERAASAGTGPRSDLGSHALLPQERVDFNVIIRPGAAELVGKAGDEGLGWREKIDPIDLAFGDDQPVSLGNISAEESLDLFIGCAEFVFLYSRDPRKRAFSLREIEAAKLIRSGLKDEDRRVVPLGRLIGVQPASGATASQSIGLRKRNELLRAARQSVAEWRELSHDAAAKAMIASFNSYKAGAWKKECDRETRPATAPNSFWWQILRIGLSKPMLKQDRLADIIGEIDDGESGGT